VVAVGGAGRRGGVAGGGAGRPSRLRHQRTPRRARERECPAAPHWRLFVWRQPGARRVLLAIARGFRSVKSAALGEGGF